MDRRSEPGRRCKPSPGDHLRGSGEGPSAPGGARSLSTCSCAVVHHLAAFPQVRGRAGHRPSGASRPRLSRRGRAGGARARPLSVQTLSNRGSSEPHGHDARRAALPAAMRHAATLDHWRPACVTSLGDWRSRVRISAPRFEKPPEMAAFLAGGHWLSPATESVLSPVRAAWAFSAPRRCDVAW